MDRRMHEGPGGSALGFDVAITRVFCKNEYRGHDEYKTNNVYPAKRSSQPQHREQSSRNRFVAGALLIGGIMLSLVLQSWTVNPGFDFSGWLLLFFGLVLFGIRDGRDQRPEQTCRG